MDFRMGLVKCSQHGIQRVPLGLLAHIVYQTDGNRFP